MRSANDDTFPDDQGTISQEDMTLLLKEGKTLTEIAQQIPGRERRGVSVGTVWRWAKRGIRGGIRLKSALVGGVRLTTWRWVEEFIEARNRQAGGLEQGQRPQPRTARQRTTGAERAAEELRKLWGRKTTD